MTVHHTHPLAVALCLVALLAGLAQTAPAAEGPKVTLEKLDGKIRVEVDGKLFTEYVYQGYEKPILYPIMGPGQALMIRHYPMKKVEGEATDHPHHKSLWYTHGAVNGVDFWAYKEGGTGKIVQDKIVQAEASGGKAVIRTTNKWTPPKGKVICTDTRTLTFSTAGSARVIDFDITLQASEGEVKLGDTKEGTMAIRTHPSLRLKGGKGVKAVTGKAVNSAGDKDGALWGKRAKWVSYWGKVDDKPVGVAIFDHPSNPRHPTWWHARDYGLITANPFGIHHFERKKGNPGEMVIPAGKSVTFRYRFVFYPGDHEQAKVPELYQQYAAGDSK